ncbi:unnamed protein product (macronuclear) [Paramecium tetraurelia]|uniref:Uncharacterized protein n=1 Tax=Paramecium tetraurelia TaxID=5888 RepID=A0C2V2_PARTE|nr:uncharacterized protein GSPATT00034597001 [Paramecium tetraurelia]CAK65119.1 unnamed protein product [Paramecium tetraurelia]|eukprot:XP_001432516.1 hypothetical protein (macronuclear) [Paramecium tetraurelia strain d4-2]
MCEHCRKRDIQKKLGYYSYSIQIEPKKSNISLKLNNNLDDKENQMIDAFNRNQTSKIQLQKKAEQASKLTLEIRFPNQQQISQQILSHKKPLIKKDNKIKK